MDQLVGELLGGALPGLEKGRGAEPAPFQMMDQMMGGLIHNEQREEHTMAKGHQPGASSKPSCRKMKQMDGCLQKCCTEVEKSCMFGNQGCMETESNNCHEMSCPKSTYLRRDEEKLAEDKHDAGTLTLHFYYLDLC
jgi:hypothetical protein